MEKSNELAGKFKIKNHKLIVEPSVFKKLEIVDREQIISEEGSDGINGFYYHYYDNMFITKEDIDLSQVLTEYASFLDSVNEMIERQEDHRGFLWVPSINRNMYFGKDEAVHYILCSSHEQVERYFYKDDRFSRMCQKYRFHLLLGSWLEHYDYLDGKEYKVEVLWYPGSVDDAATYGNVTRKPVVQETENTNNEKKGFFRRLFNSNFS